MVFFDAETEQICEELGYDLILPSAELREHLDSKLVTTRLGNDVGAGSVPNVLVTIEEYEELLEVATGAGLGTDLVVQTAYGDSGVFGVKHGSVAFCRVVARRRRAGSAIDSDQSL
jgi:biotin carboxylase